MREFLDAFKALRGAPRALWLVIFAFSLESMAYFGILPLMKPYISQDIGISPALASTWVSPAGRRSRLIGHHARQASAPGTQPVESSRRGR